MPTSSPDSTAFTPPDVLLRNARRYEALFEQAGDAVFLFGWEGLVTMANAAACRMWGMTHAQFVGMKADDLLEPAQFEASPMRYPSLAPGEVARTERMAQRADGTVFPVEITTVRLDDGYQGIVRDISERRRAEEALRAERARHALVFRHAPACIATLRGRGLVVELANERAQRIAGGRLQVGRPLHEAMPELEESGLLERLRQVLERGEELAQRGVPVQVREADGTMCHVFVDFVYQPLPGVDGTMDGVLVHGVDVTEQVLAQREREVLLERLAEQRANFHAVADSSPDGFMLFDGVHDASGSVVDFTWSYCNAAAAHIARRPRAALIGRSLLEEMPDIRPEGLFDLFVEVTRTGVPRQHEYTYRREGWNNTFRMLAIRVGSGFGLLFSDITTQHVAAEALRRSEARFRAVMDRAADLVAILDGRGALQYASPSYARGLGYDPAALLNLSAFDLVHPDDLPAVLDVFDRLSRDPGASTALEFRARHADGRWRTFAAHATNLFADPAVEGLVVSGHDVTEERQLEVRLRQAQKMEAVGQLAGGIAHDFNNLLTVIKANAEFLALETAGQPRDDVEEIRKAATRAASLTRQLLAFSRQQVLAPRVVDPNAVITDLERMLARLIGEDIECVLTLGRGVGQVLVDPGQLEQILLNLAVNARDAMPLGGALSIATSRAALPDAIRAARPELPARAWVRIAVQDTGCGMSPETMGRVFDPFFTTKEMGKGTGLGLATVYGIVEQSGGVIDVQSAPGHGSTFTLYFPATDDRPVAEAPEPGAPAHAARTETILLVEDDDAVRAVALRMLSAAGFRVVVARHGAEALLRMSESATPVDLLLTDAVMPQMGGLELLRAAESFRPGIAAVLMSGYTDDELVRRGGTLEAVILLQKPFTRERLLEAVDEALGQRRGTDAQPRS
jgi:PAS domain S-box-containing protein